VTAPGGRFLEAVLRSEPRLRVCTARAMTLGPPVPGSSRTGSGAPTSSPLRSRISEHALDLDHLADRALEFERVLDRDALCGVAVAAPDGVEHHPLLVHDVVEAWRERRIAFHRHVQDAQ
jgi:hypothetical protein